jgi:alkanesulfonate monooxygenase
LSGGCGTRTTSLTGGEYFGVEHSSLRLKPQGAADGRHPRLYFGGASAAAERVSAAEADVQLFWGEPLDGVAERIDRLRALSAELGREHQALEFGLRITTLVRDTSDEAWKDAEDRVARMAAKAGQRGTGQGPVGRRWSGAVGQRRLLSLHERGEVLDSCLYTTPGQYGGGGAGTTWLVGSYEEVAAALRKYADLGISHFVLSDTPYQEEAIRTGDHLLPLLR